MLNGFVCSGGMGELMEEWMEGGLNGGIDGGLKEKMVERLDARIEKCDEGIRWKVGIDRWTFGWRCR